MFSDFVRTAEEISATTKKSAKEQILADYISRLDDPDLERAVVFFSGSPFPRKEEKVTGVGWATIADAVSDVLGAPWNELGSTERHGDMGDAVAELFGARGMVSSNVTLGDVADSFARLALISGSTKKREILAALLARLGSAEARFIVKILLSEFRIGLQEGLVESAIARAFARPLPAVRQAHMFSGDLGATALLARAGTLESVSMTLFHPIALMLAQPEEDPAAIVGQLGEGALADDKYDGIRAQIHIDGGQVRIYSRTLDQITHRFPEVEAASRDISGSAILDGEIVAYDERILPFA
ncbi:MAG TPA: hypothetical protein VNM92_16980, partial [Thermoanaerobaculia bacterium]|nr:hypothetical protein [Thermoanaerobaculia bacterium]